MSDFRVLPGGNQNSQPGNNNQDIQTNDSQGMVDPSALGRARIAAELTKDEITKSSSDYGELSDRLRSIRQTPAAQTQGNENDTSNLEADKDGNILQNKGNPMDKVFESSIQWIQTQMSELAGRLYTLSGGRSNPSVDAIMASDPNSPSKSNEMLGIANVSNANSPSPVLKKE